MSSQITYAYKRHNTWVYRRTYPQRLKGILGSALKQSLKTHDAKVARKRVAELNARFEEIVAQADIQLADAGDAMTIAVAVPRFQRARLLGEQRVEGLAVAYLEETSRRLAPGSYKSVRFAIELLVSHLGHRQMRELTESMGREVLGYVQRLSPNVRKYREGKEASRAARHGVPQYPEMVRHPVRANWRSGALHRLSSRSPVGAIGEPAHLWALLRRDW